MDAPSAPVSRPTWSLSPRNGKPRPRTVIAKLSLIMNRSSASAIPRLTVGQRVQTQDSTSHRWDKFRVVIGCGRPDPSVSSRTYTNKYKASLKNVWNVAKEKMEEGLEEELGCYKEEVMKRAETMCGRRLTGGSKRKGSEWWNEEKHLSSFKTNTQISALLLPISSGANGLNLIEAQHVILVEPILNPASELQAIGRVHRIGQSKETFVHRFLVRGTIEERMHHVIRYHHEQVNTDENTVTLEDLRNLFVHPEELELRQQLAQTTNKSDAMCSDESAEQFASTPSGDILNKNASGKQRINEKKTIPENPSTSVYTKVNTQNHSTIQQSLKSDATCNESAKQNGSTSDIVILDKSLSCKHNINEVHCTPVLCDSAYSDANTSCHTKTIERDYINQVFIPDESKPSTSRDVALPVHYLPLPGRVAETNISPKSVICHSELSQTETQQENSFNVSTSLMPDALCDETDHMS
ncbi:hypothetical protein SK128_005040 [Halocaridina rubra]|uniref:Helicase C-terminal domain-containing protein n=1 Tax=Halocaridina rubra TaxID=373956 RepID=A0AAN8X0T5_HALRR